MTLSVCLIVKDEQDVIGRCLNCASKFADEIIVVDTGSTDSTVAEAKKFTDNVYFFKWRDDFSAARNYAFEKATCGLIMWLDADDTVTDENCEKIVKLKNSFKGYDMAFLPYAAAFDGEKPTFIYNRERIFRRDMGFKFAGAVHEAVTPRGRIMYSDAVIYHKKVKEGDPLRNLRILQGFLSSGKGLEPRQKFYYGRELLFNNMTVEAVAVFEDFLSGDGWAVNKAEACLNLYAAYMRLNDETRALAAALRSFVYMPPTAYACCILGEYFMRAGENTAAVYWYTAALTASGGERDGAFVNLDYSGFIPYMQLCVLYDRLGETEKANACNEAAGAIKPHNENYLSNKKYFAAKTRGK